MKYVPVCRNVLKMLEGAKIIVLSPLRELPFLAHLMDFDLWEMTIENF